MELPTTNSVSNDGPKPWEPQPPRAVAILGATGALCRRSLVQQWGGGTTALRSHKGQAALWSCEGDRRHGSSTEPSKGTAARRLHMSELPGNAGWNGLLESWHSTGAWCCGAARVLGTAAGDRHLVLRRGMGARHSGVARASSRAVWRGCLALRGRTGFQNRGAA